MRKVLFSGLLSIIVLSSSSQIALVKTSSDRIDIRDGLHFKKAAWKISPGLNKYYVELPHKDHRVFLYTDSDSIHFDISYGGVYNLAFLLNGKDTCYAQVLASQEKAIKYNSPHENNMPDTIPFSLINNKIYLQGSINQGNSTNILFDLGTAGTSFKNPSLIKEKNEINIAGVRWDSLEVIKDSQFSDSKADAVIGNSLFADKVVKIDYDNLRMIVSNSLAGNDTGYSRHELVLENNTIPMIQAAIATKDTTCMTWFALGTGNSQNSFVDKNTALQYNLYKGSNRYFTWNKEVYVKYPELKVANLSFLNISSTIGNRNNTGTLSQLGNGLMKRFNIILDNQNGFIYLKPNSLRATPYDNTFLIIYSVLTGIVIVLILLIGSIVRFFRRRAKNRILMMTNTENYNNGYYPESAS